jgi:hypothetical protein
MTFANVIMLVLLAWVLIACWCLVATLWEHAKEDFRQ